MRRPPSPHLAGGDLDVGALFEALKFAIAYPGDAIGDIEHLGVVRGGDDGDALFRLQALEATKRTKRKQLRWA